MSAPQKRLRGAGITRQKNQPLIIADNARIRNAYGGRVLPAKKSTFDYRGQCPHQNRISGSLLLAVGRRGAAPNPRSRAFAKTRSRCSLSKLAIQ